MRSGLTAGVVLLGLVLSGCGGDDGGSDSSAGGSASGSEIATGPGKPSASAPYSPKPYEPEPAEEFPNGKRLAARVAQRALTYAPGESALDVARSLPPAQVDAAELARVLEPVIYGGTGSVGEVVYPQLSGVTETTLGAMVITRQVLKGADGESESLTRVLDVRLRLSRGSWLLDRIGSVGGSPVPAPSSLPPSAQRVLDNPNITLSDSARWDIYRGMIDTALLAALAKAAKRHEFSVGILRSGHPTNVWATSRPSAHSQGFAADIDAVDGLPVVRQNKTRSPAYELARELSAGGAYQLGSPWVFGGGESSFTDAVHKDHIHLQQSPAL